MLLVVLGALLAAIPYWLLVPAGARRAAATLASLAVLGAVDVRLPPLLLAVAGLCWGAGRTPAGAARNAVATVGLAALVALFVWNKRAAVGIAGPLATQGQLAFLGASYVVLKAAAVLVDVARADLPTPGFGRLVAWLAFAPTMPAGPIEPFGHFDAQTPTWNAARAGRGVERVRVGAVKALVVGRWLGEWAAPILATPAAHGRLALVAALDATALRFYLDFAGYSDVAIGLAAVFGVAILENFDRPFLRRNLALLWQHWHMTLTHWLRTYLFVPTSRFLLRRTPQLGDRVALACAQLVTMGVCGLWHGLSWNFLCWGLVQALGLAWVGLAARDVGRRLPAGVVAWWRASRAGAVCSTLVTVQFFALSLAFVVADVGGAVRLLARLVVG